MKILELFSGTESFSKVARERGHECFTIDNDPKFKPSLCADIMTLKAGDIPFKPDVIWSSPPCQKFSIMTVYRNWKKNADGSYEYKNDETLKAIALHTQALSIMKTINPKLFFIENPRGMLRKMKWMENIPRFTVTYCKYGMPYQKATDIWSNCKTWIPREVCKANSPCHVRAPRGSRYGVQGIDGYRRNREQKHFDISMMKDIKHYRRTSLHSEDLGDHCGWNATTRRGMIPRELCEEILIACERELK